MISIKMDKRSVLIIDKDIEFCLILGNSLSRRNIDTYYTDSITEGLEIIELKRPFAIVADKYLKDLETSLHIAIDAINDYDPDVFLLNTKSLPANSIMDIIDEIMHGNNR